MTDPRANVDIVEVGAVVATFKIDNSTVTYLATASGGSSQVGLAVNLSASDTVQLAGDGEAVLGKLIAVYPDNMCSVQVQGGMTLPGGTGASLTRGKKVVGDLLVAAKGYIREVNTAAAGEIGLARGLIIANGTTTAVKVFLE